MTPAQRERLRVALERETGLPWVVIDCDAIVVRGEWCLARYRSLNEDGSSHFMAHVNSGDHRTYARLDAHATGRGWPEHLAAEVGRVIRESNNSPARVGEE